MTSNIILYSKQQCNLGVFLSLNDILYINDYLQAFKNHCMKVGYIKDGVTSSTYVYCPNSVSKLPKWEY